MRVWAGLLALAMLSGSCRQAPELGANGVEMSIQVDGQPVRFAKSEAEFGELLGSYDLTLLSHDGEMNRLVLRFRRDEADLGAWVGKPFEREDWSQDNPGKSRQGLEIVLNRFRANGKYYEAYSLDGGLEAYDGRQVTVAFEGVFLEHPDDLEDDDDGSEAPGREVRVQGRVTVPVTLEPA